MNCSKSPVLKQFLIVQCFRELVENDVLQRDDSAITRVLPYSTLVFHLYRPTKWYPDNFQKSSALRKEMPHQSGQNGFQNLLFLPNHPYSLYCVSASSPFLIALTMR